MPRRSRLTIATVNVNGLRAAATNGIKGWLDDRQPDIVTMQEVRAPDALVPELVKSVAGAASAAAPARWDRKCRRDIPAGMAAERNMAGLLGTARRGPGWPGRRTVSD